MNPLLPVMDFNRGVLIARKDGHPASHPCGGCVPWSIYVVCWRSGGCGVSPCERDIYLDSPPSGACAMTYFAFTGTLVNKVYWGPVSAPVTGTAEIEYVIDQVSYGSETVNCTESVDCDSEFDCGLLEEPLAGVSGWHSIKAYVVWKDSNGDVFSRETYSACLAVGILPSGEDEPALHDVMLLPGSAAEVCLNETLAATKLCGSYKSYFDAHFVRTYWASVIDAYADHCICSDECQRISPDGGGRGFGIDEDVTPIPGTTSTYDITPSALEGNQDWTGCLPADYPLYVDLDMEFWSESGIGDIEINGVYIRFWTASDVYNRETWTLEDEIELSADEQGVYVYDGMLVIPPCQFITMELSLSARPQGSEYFDSAANWSSRYSSDPNFVEEYEDCPYLDEQDNLIEISEYLPTHEETLREWLAEHTEDVQTWWEGQQEE